jgi:hypothetical protein
MKFVQINKDDTMHDCNEDINLRNIKKVMRNISGLSKINELYNWPYENGVVRCYGNVSGKAGQENKHDLPTSGIRMKDSLDNSDTQLLFNDIFMVRVENKKCIDFDIADYGLFYTLCFEGFDDCNSDDVTSDESDEEGSLTNFIIADNVVSSSDESYELPDNYTEDSELDEDDTEY